MFQLTEIEMHHLVSQNVIPSLKYFGGAKVYAFTEHGVAMLSSVLRSKKAIQINISIMRAFVMMRQWALTHQELSARLDALISLKETKTLEASKNPIPIRRLVEIKCIFV
jgi:hypothetical protein